jgi:hypothetical protein
MIRYPRIRVLHAFILLSSLFYFWLMARLVSGSYFNSYPFISADGFDYILEGFTIYLRLSGAAVGSLLILRNPVFVLVTTVDAALRANGLLVLFSIAGAIYAMHLGMMLIADTLRVSRKITAAFVVASLYTPLSYFRLWILSDVIAIAFMMFSIYCLFRYEEPGRPVSWLVAAVGCAVLAGLTQTYGLIPFLVGAGAWWLADLFRDRRIRWDLAVAVLAAAVAEVALQLIWVRLIPFEARPTTFDLLQLNFHMFGFYAHLWTFAYLALVPFVVLTLRRVGWQPLFGSTHALALWLMVIVFALLTFFYQWPDARFTYVYQPILFLALMALTAPEPGTDAGLGEDRWLERLSQVTAALIILQSLFVVPDYWQPRMTNLRISASQSWLGQALSAHPQDRNLLGEYCPSPAWVCSEAKLPEGADSYVTRIHTDFRKYQREAAERGYFGAGTELTRPPALPVPPRSLADVRSHLQPAHGLTGYVESVSQTGPNLVITGWAADVAQKRAVTVLRVYVRGNSVAAGAPNWVRADVSSALGLPGNLKTGFRFDLPIKGAPVAQGDLRVFAEFSDGTSGELSRIPR